MNKEYYANNDKIIVSNESGELRELPNYDNYQERLNTENIIEELDSTINFEEYMKNTYPVDEGKDIKISKILLNLIIIFAPILIGGMLKDAGINLPLVYMSSIVMSVPTLASIVLGIGVVLVNGVKAIKKYKTNKMNKRMRLSYEASIDYLKEKAPSTLVLKVDATKVKSAINVGMLNETELAQYTKLSERISLTPAKNK